MFGLPRVPGILAMALQIVLLLCSAAIAGVIAYKFHPMPPSLYIAEEPAGDGEVNMAKVAELEAAGGVLWIDARVRSRFDEGHIPGALLLNPEEFDALVFKYFETFETNEKPIVLYCDAQKCAASKKVAERMKELNLAMSNEVYVLRGGWNAWRSAQKE